MRFFVLPILDGVKMDGYQIFWVVDTGVNLELCYFCIYQRERALMESSAGSQIKLPSLKMSMNKLIGQKYHYIILLASFE